MADAQAKSFKVDWSDAANTPVTPKKLGVTVYMDYPIEDVVEYVDWNPFFQVGQVVVCVGKWYWCWWLA